MGIPCHFALFELQPGFRLDLEQLATRYRELARGVHPDRFADASEREQRSALSSLPGSTTPIRRSRVRPSAHATC